LKHQNQQQKAEKCKTYGIKQTAKRILTYTESWNKKVEFHLVLPQLRVYTFGQLRFLTLCMPVNDHKSVVSKLSYIFNNLKLTCLD
jgi:hypothetical protein